MENPFKKALLGAAIGSSLAAPEAGHGQVPVLDGESVAITRHADSSVESPQTISFEQALVEMRKHSPEAYRSFLFSQIDSAEHALRQGKKERDHDGVQVVVYGEHELTSVAFDNFALGNMVAATYDIQAGLLQGGVSVFTRGRDLERIDEEREEASRISGKPNKTRDVYSRPDFFVVVRLLEREAPYASHYEAVLYNSEGSVVTTIDIPLVAEVQNITHQQDRMLEAIGEQISVLTQK